MNYAWVWEYRPTRHCGRCNNPHGVYNQECTGPHTRAVLIWARVEEDAA